MTMGDSARQIGGERGAAVVEASRVAFVRGMQLASVVAGLGSLAAAWWFNRAMAVAGSARAA